MRPAAAPLTLGVAAMPAKAASGPMRAILAALAAAAPHLRIVVLDAATLLAAPAAAWPRVDALLAFHSAGFPLSKVVEYGAAAAAAAARPAMVNDLGMQAVLLDRGLVRAALRAAGVAQPHAIVVREGGGARARVEGDELVVAGAEGGAERRMRKPFVEKPLCADDHNVFVYYRGGGVRRLFRKRGGVSSVYVAGAGGRVRERGGGGGYLYQEFCESAVDVKVYAVAGEHFHAEERKAPTVDGRVERGADGREVRRRTALTRAEAGLCGRVAAAFRQFVVGFDIVRAADGRSYVIDVNGWSFVKGDPAFADLCGRRLARWVREHVGAAPAAGPAGGEPGGAPAAGPAGGVAPADALAVGACLPCAP